MNEPRYLLRAESISKSFGVIKALAGLTLELRPGTIHALVGANAAGKSTLIRVLMGLETPDTGSLVTPRSPLRVGYQPQVPALYDYLTIAEFLDLAALIGGPAAGSRDDLMALFDLTAIGGQLLHTTSVGTKMKLAIAAAMIQNPDLLVLDEPTNALDAIAVARLKQRLRDMKAAGATILLATHMIEFAEHLSDDITVLRAGQVMYSGTLQAFGPASATLESRILPLI